jgi:uncharacterized protein (UPF0248 family)
MTKKGEIKEWISRILFGEENPHDFSVLYRDFNEYVEVSFIDFIERQREDNIPNHRISQIRKKNVPVFTRPNFCHYCGRPLQKAECINNFCEGKSV